MFSQPQPAVSCELCNMDFNSQSVLESHLIGSKHQKKAGNIQGLANGQSQNGSFACEVCCIQFNSITILESHLAGSKHQKKIKSEELLKAFTSTESEFETDSKTGSVRCLVCDLSLNSPHILAAHLAGSRHKISVERRAAVKYNSAMYGQHNTTNGNNIMPIERIQSGSDANNPLPEYKPPRVNNPNQLPAYVTCQPGNKYLCTPCNAMCNSEHQISQHLTSKKHQAKV